MTSRPAALTRLSQPAAWAVLLGVYLVAAAVASLAVDLLSDAAALADLGRLAPLAIAYGADVAATVAVFAFSRAFTNSSTYDPFWSVAPPLLLAWFALGPGGGESTRTVIAATLVTAWGARLTWNFLRGWPGFGHEDWRYGKYRNQTGRAWFFVDLFAIHLMPTTLVFAGCLPLFLIATRGGPLGALDLAGALVTAAAIAIEATADAQLRAFKASAPHQTAADATPPTDAAPTPQAPPRTLDTGLWRHSRHPNYFGEVLFWWGLALLGLAADPSAWWCITGAALINGLFVFISIPLMDRRMLKRRPTYSERMRSARQLIPLPRARPGS